MKYQPVFLRILMVLALLAVLPAISAGASTEVHIVLYAADGFTVLNETTVDYRWMEQNLPVMGDGTTHYYLQGPVFVDNPEDRWNPEEDTNVLEKDMGAVKGTDLRDLCDLVGGMEPGDTVTLRASDGFSKTFAYENVYEPPARQGEMVITWYEANKSYVPQYTEGMRLIFFADTSTNPWGIHAFGVWDWHESAAEEYWYYYHQGGEAYPTTTGLSVMYVSDIQIWSSREPVGSIGVASDPAGARVYLDGVDTGYDTPCTLEELADGFYSLNVQKNGYLTSEEQSVEVKAGTKTPVSFVLEPVSQGSGGSGTGDGESAALLTGEDQDIFTGGQLSGTDSLHVNGTLVLLPSPTSPFVLTGGKEHILTFNTSTLPSTLFRLYLFLDRSAADSTGPQVTVSTADGERAPVRTYSERGSDGDTPYATTLVYSLPQWTGNGTVTISSRNSPSWNCTVAGALLVGGSEDEESRGTQAWICEGADLIGEIPGQESPLTLADFSAGAPALAGGNATLWTVTTPASAAGNLSFFVNGVSTPARLVSGPGPVVVYGIPGSELPKNTVIRLHIATAGPPVTNRVAVLAVVSSQQPSILPGPGHENVTIQTQPAHTAVPSTPGPEKIPGEVLPEGEQRRSDPVGDFFCWLLNFLLALEGQPPENCYRHNDATTQGNNTAVPARDTPATRVGVSVSSSPDGAMVFLDGQASGKVTPCTLDVSSDGEHTVRITKEGYLPFEQQITGPEEIDALLLPEVDLSEQNETPLQQVARSHHGGVYIHSYPEQAEIRIDGVVVGTSSPVLVSPLKEGFHTISAGILTGGNTYSARESIRTWIFPDAIMPVEFNLMDADVSFPVNITGESRTGARFTVNGYYPVKRIPERADFSGNTPFITVTNGSSYLSFSIPESSRETGVFTIPWSDPPVCNLTIESVPEGAEIFLDGIRTGLLTPAVISNVSAGYHRISITQQERIPVTELIRIPESQCMQGEYMVRYTTDWYASGNLHLTSDPPGAAVSFRGLKTGEETPCTLENIPIGVWEVMLTDGKMKKGIDATVEPGSTRMYSVVFD
jgi:hypothetical protein